MSPNLVPRWTMWGTVSSGFREIEIGWDRLESVGHVAPSVAPDRRLVAESATVVHMPRAVSIRELRNSTSAVVSELEAGERLTLTVNRRPVADILPHVADRDPWVPASELHRIMTEAPADTRLLEDLADVRGAELDD